MVTVPARGRGARGTLPGEPVPLQAPPARERGRRL